MAAVLALGCTTIDDHTDVIFSKGYAVPRSQPVLSIDREAHQYVRRSGYWEMPRFRKYAQGDLDDDSIDDTAMLTTYESGQYYKRVMFVACSSKPAHVMTIEIGGKGERMATNLEVAAHTIVVTGLAYATNDGMCCPSIPFREIIPLTNGVTREPQQVGGG